MSLEDILRECASGYADPRRLHGAESLRLACSVSFNEDAQVDIKGPGIPEEMGNFWAVCESAQLFFDVDYGQWGLSMLSVSQSAERTREEFSRRPKDMVSGDLVIGSFLGDSDLLIYAGMDVQDKRILVGLPLDSRDEWYTVGRDLKEFLSDFVRYEGRKFWE